MAVLLQIFKSILEVFAPRLIDLLTQPKTESVDLAEARLTRISDIDDRDLVNRFDVLLRD